MSSFALILKANVSPIVDEEPDEIFVPIPNRIVEWSIPYPVSDICVDILGTQQLTHDVLMIQANSDLQCSLTPSISQIDVYTSADQRMNVINPIQSRRMKQLMRLNGRLHQQC